MTIRKTYSLIAIAALLVCFAVIFFSHHTRRDREVYVYAQPFHTDYGWGYNILADGEVHIKQQYMPAVPGRRGFKTEADALRVGNLVVRKITQNQLPTITIHELDSMGLYKDSVSR